MNTTRLALCLTFAFFLFGVAHGAKVTFMNKCPYTVWPGTLAIGSNTQLPKTGFELPSGGSDSLDVPSQWKVQFWGRTGCSTKSGKFVCESGDCGSGEVACKGQSSASAATLAELHVAPTPEEEDTYDVSNVNGLGFNVPMSMAPEGGSGECKASSCGANMNAACPAKLQEKGRDGKVVGCKNACAAFNDPKNCCTGDYGSAEKCHETEYSKFFKKHCPLAYSYPFDDDKSTIFKCSKGPSYTLTFCP